MTQEHDPSKRAAPVHHALISPQGSTCFRHVVTTSRTHYRLALLALGIARFHLYFQLMHSPIITLVLAQREAETVTGRKIISYLFKAGDEVLRSVDSHLRPAGLFRKVSSASGQARSE